jgi:acetyl esterase/lipase
MPDLTTSCAPFPILLEHVPARRFPYQVQQVCQSYSFLVEDCKIPPHRIVLAGDSAGANLILSFLHHCTFPNPFISTIHTAPPAFAILISPWSNLACPAPETNNSSIADFIHAPSLRHHAALYAGIASSPRPPLSLLTVALESLYIFAEGSPRYSAEEQELIKQSQSNPSISPLSCRDWSQTLPSCGICVTYGSTELLAQDAVNLAFSLKKTGVVPVEVYERRNMPHVWPMFALYLGASEEERSEGPRFLAERIKSSLQTRS